MSLHPLWPLIHPRECEVLALKLTDETATIYVIALVSLERDIAKFMTAEIIGSVWGFV